MEERIKTWKPEIRKQGNLAGKNRKQMKRVLGTKAPQGTLTTARSIVHVTGELSELSDIGWMSEKSEMIE